MLTRIKVLLQDRAIYIAVFVTLLIAYLSLVKLELKVANVTFSDKIGHGIAYFTLAIFWLLSFVKKKNFKSLAWYSILGCIIYGIIIEAVQGTVTSYRTASYLDIVANSMGVLVAGIAFHLSSEKNRLI